MPVVVNTPANLPAAQLPYADTIVIGGTPCPGKVTITGGNKAFRWQVNLAPWTSGATVNPLGDDIIEFDVLVQLWTARHWQDWQTFAKSYLSTAVVSAPGGVTSLALSIQHPILNAPPLSLDHVLVKRMTPMVNDGTGLWSCTISFMQFRPQTKPAKSRPNAAIPAAAKPQPTIQDAQDAQIQKLQAQMQALGGPGP
jgi:hypothetical protein